MAQRNSRRRSRVVIALQVVAAVNVVAGAAYLTVRTVARESAGTTSESNGKRDLARAARASGLAELERGDFRQAVSSFNRGIELVTQAVSSASNAIAARCFISVAPAQRACRRRRYRAYNRGEPCGML